MYWIQNTKEPFLHDKNNEQVTLAHTISPQKLNTNQIDLPKNNQVLINYYIKCFPLYF